MVMNQSSLSNFSSKALEKMFGKDKPPAKTSAIKSKYDKEFFLGKKKGKTPRKRD